MAEQGVLHVTGGPITLVTLEPMNWIGKPFPLNDFLDAAELPKNWGGDNWTVLLHNGNCSVCEGLLHELADKADSVRLDRLAVIEVPGGAAVEVPAAVRERAGLVCSLRRSSRWFAPSPVVLTLENGTVAKVRFKSARRRGMCFFQSDSLSHRQVRCLPMGPAFTRKGFAMKKFAVSLCLLAGISLFLGVGFVSVGRDLPGASVDSFDVTAGRLQGQCKPNTGAACPGPTVPCNKDLYATIPAGSIGYCSGSCSAAKHDTLDDSEAGTASMADSDCCRLTKLCRAFWDEQGNIAFTMEGPMWDDYECPMNKTRNECTQQ